MFFDEAQNIDEKRLLNKNPEPYLSNTLEINNNKTS